MRLRIATCRPLPEPDPDEEILLEALRARGVDARMAAWNDPRENWHEPEPTVIRSTWDYVHDFERFLAWARAAESVAPLWNPFEAVRWNAHKRYLSELEQAGHAVVPTVLVDRRSRASLFAVAREHDWNDVVVKPAVSAASFGTRRFGAGDLREGEQHLAALLVEGDAMIQPYVESVDGHGERALVWIDGEFTHAVRKTARFTGQDEQVSHAVPIEADELALGRAVLAWWSTNQRVELLYARVDVARDADGRPMIMELELIEPSLFLVQSAPALQRLADGICRRLH
jgi:hypothetical protein